MTTSPVVGFTPPVDSQRALDELSAVVESSGSDACDAFLMARQGQYTRFANGRIHQPQDVNEVQVMVRAVVDGHAARAAASGLDDLAAAAAWAESMAHSLASAATQPGSTTVAQLSDHRTDETVPDDVVWCADTEAFDEVARCALIDSAHAEAERAGADAGSVAGMVGRAVTQLVVATSGGVRRSTAATEASGAFTFVVGDGTAHFTDLGRSAERLELPDAIRSTAAQAAACRGRIDLDPGEYTVVLGPEATAELIEFLPSFGFSGELAAAGVGLCATAPGLRVASPLVSISDDAGIAVGLPVGFDVEGVSKQRVPLIDAGRVGSCVTDLKTAALLGTPSTGHAHIAREEVPATAAANLLFHPGTSTESELIAGVRRGVYIQRFWYTRLVDPTATTITGVTRDACFEIRDGELAAPLTGMRFTQSVLDLLATVDAVGAGLRSSPLMNVWNGAVSAPAIRGHGFRLGEANPLRTGVTS